MRLSGKPIQVIYDTDLTVFFYPEVDFARFVEQVTEHPLSLLPAQQAWRPVGGLQP